MSEQLPDGVKIYALHHEPTSCGVPQRVKRSIRSADVLKKALCIYAQFLRVNVGKKEVSGRSSRIDFRGLNGTSNVALAS